MQQKFFATTAKAMEALLADELKALGALNVTPTRAGVSFEGTLETAYKACLWSRVANRVLLPLKQFAAPSPEKLYGEVKSIRWSDHLSNDKTFAVDFSSTQSEISHTQFGALKVKDAIVDQFRSVTGERPSVDTQKPDLRINVYLNENLATLSIDLSGTSLHQRGYRDEDVPAPLKENLAAALLLSAGWPEAARAGYEFLDPMCGSGTLPIEAAWMALGIAPGILRTYFGFFGWKKHDPAIWDKVKGHAQKIRDEALDPEKRKPNSAKPASPPNLPSLSSLRIQGYDQDFRAVRSAIANAERAGLRGLVHIEKREFSEIAPMSNRGMILLNPPYGERLGEVEELKPLYEEIGDTFKKKFKGWNGFVFTGSPDLAKMIGLKPSRKIVLFNGAIECRLLKFELYEGTKRTDLNNLGKPAKSAAE